MEEKDKVTLLWSGGWDGTFRLLQLAENDIQIQPIYVTDKNRRSNTYEKGAMEKILKEIGVGGFKAEIHPIVYYDVSWILENCRNNEISEAFQYLHSKYRIGTQYEWFALLCKKLGVKMESAVVHQYHGKVEDAIKAEGTLAPVENDFLEGRFQVLPKNESKAAFHVFGNIIFPVMNLTKEDEKRIAEEKGWMDIMKLSWFCHSPINGEPCGICSPCEDAMNTGMEWRMPQKAQARYRFRKVYHVFRSGRYALRKIISRTRDKS